MMHLGNCFDNMDRKALDERKKIKLKMQERPTELKFQNALVKQCILASVESCDDWRPSVAAEAFNVLEKLTVNLMFNPDRKLYHELKTYSGTFKHILSRLAMIDDILREIGYKRDSNSYYLHHLNDNLSSLSNDFLHASILCEIMDDLYGLESIDNRRLMCKIRLDPGYLEHQEAEKRVIFENGHRERPSPPGRVKFLEGDSYSYHSPKPRPPKDLSSIACTDNKLSRPKPRSILRHPGSSTASTSTPYDESEYRVRNSGVPIPVERFESHPPPRIHVETKPPNIRVASVPPPNYPSSSHHHSHSRPSPSIDYRGDDIHVSRTVPSNAGLGRYHHHLPEQEVIMRSGHARGVGMNHHQSTTNRRRSNHESTVSRRERAPNRPSSITESQRHSSGLSGFRR